MVVQASPTPTYDCQNHDQRHNLLPCMHLLIDVHTATAAALASEQPGADSLTRGTLETGPCHWEAIRLVLRV